MSIEEAKEERVVDIRVGDTAWRASFDAREVRVTCPVCFGKRRVRIVFGDDSVHEIDCDYCGHGFLGPQGTVTEYVREPRAESVVIDGIERIEGVGAMVKYRHGCANHYRTYEAGELFATREEALVAAGKMAEEWNRCDQQACKVKANKSYAWNAGYHRREAKRCREAAERHEAKAKLCAEKSKDHAGGVDVAVKSQTAVGASMAKIKKAENDFFQA